LGGTEVTVVHVPSGGKSKKNQGGGGGGAKEERWGWGEQQASASKGRGEFPERKSRSTEVGHNLLNRNTSRQERTPNAGKK